MTAGKKKSFFPSTVCATGVLAGGFRVKAMIGPTIDQPTHIGRDGVDVLDVFLGRVRVVHAQVAWLAKLAGDAVEV